MDKLELKNIAVEQGLDFDGVIELVFDAQQAKVEELQKRVEAALELMQKPVIVGEPANYVCARFKDIEQALKGEGQ